MRKHVDTIFEWLIKVIIFGICMAIILCSLASCRILKSHKQTTNTTLDSTHQVLNKSQNGIKSDSTVHSDKKDSSGKQSWWNYEKETTTTVDWYFLPPVKRNYPDSEVTIGSLVETTTQPLMKRETTVTKERGQQYISESHKNSDIIDAHMENLDTSSASQSENTQLQKTATTKVNDRSVRSIPAWLVITTVLVALIIVWLNLSPGQVSWILALFRRKKTGDKS